MTTDEPGQQDLLPGLAASASTAPAGRSAKAPANAPANAPAKAPAKGQARRKAPVKPAEPLAAEDPIARVLVDVPLAHLDRPFDYAVPESMAADLQPGVRVKVRFAGQDVDGFVVVRTDDTEHTGRLTPVRRVVSPEPVLGPEIAELTAEVAERYAGTRADVLRLAVPKRHATTEKADAAAAPEELPPVPALGEWADYPAGAAYLANLRAGTRPRAVWQAAPGADWPTMLALAAATNYHCATGRGSIICVPDARDLARVDAALTEVLGKDHHVTLSADAGPAKRYREFLAVSRGARRIVVGTRTTAFAPVHDLGLVAIWDDGDDSYAELRAPYPHAREVLLMRAQRQGLATLLGGFGRSVEAEYLLTTGWAREVAPTREEIRRRVTVAATGATDRAVERDPAARTARLPSEVHEVIRSGLATGPVLVQTPRLGYAAALACARCRHPARCDTCSGPLRLTGPANPPECAWCGTRAPGWACPQCGHRGLRAPVVGDRRTAEELGRSFPGTRVVASSGDTVLDRVPGDPAIVVATPGAEPVAAGGYRAVVLLDAWLALARTDLRGDEEAGRRWFNAAGLVAPGGRVEIVGESAHPVVQALVRWDPGGFARREMAERQAAHLPPASRLATVEGDPASVEQALAGFTCPPGTEVLGPVPLTHDPAGNPDDAEVRMIVRAPRARGEQLSRALGDLQRTRSARKLSAVRIQVDPRSIG